VPPLGYRFRRLLPRPQDATDEEKAVTLFTPHTRPVSVLHFDSGAKLYSSSYDNTVRCMDLHAMQFVETWAGDEDDFLAYMALEEQVTAGSVPSLRVIVWTRPHRPSHCIGCLIIAGCDAVRRVRLSRLRRPRAG
jgi:WD40 repeat protein